MEAPVTRETPPQDLQHQDLQRRDIQQIERGALRRALVALNMVREDRGLVCALAGRLQAEGDLTCDRFARQAAERLEAPAAKVRETLHAARGRLDLAADEEAKAREAGATVVTLVDAGYPRALDDLGQHAPPVLYVRGTLHDAPGIAIVGARKADAYGLEVAGWFARRLAAAGLVVISGFARGIDQTAHRSALSARAGSGRTAAVLGCGLDIDYPRGSRRLADEIARQGCLITEFPFGWRPRPWHFPVRNRIIAALGFASIVVRAACRSGSLVTARLALDLGREVYAVPGSVLSRASAGAHLLLRDGAIPALDPDELVQTLPSAVLDRLKPAAPDEAGGSGGAADATSGAVATGAGGAGSEVDPLLAALEDGARAPEELAACLGLPIQGVLATLARLEVDGVVCRSGGAAYALAAR